MMDAKYLAEIRKRCDDATPGPWFNFGNWAIHTEPDVEKNGIPGSSIVATTRSASKDSAFIAHARADIPALLAEAERLQKCRDGCKIDCLLEQYNQAQEQISKLKAEKARAENALELACRYHRFDDFKTVQAEMDFFTKQAREQEGHDEKV